VIDIRVRWTPARAWQQLGAVKSLAAPLAEIARTAAKIVAERITERGELASAPAESYKPTWRPDGRSRRHWVKPPRPIPLPERHRIVHPGHPREGWGIYQDRREYLRALGVSEAQIAYRDAQRPRRYFRTGEMWRRWRVEMTSPTQARVRFYGTHRSSGLRTSRLAAALDAQEGRDHLISLGREEVQDLIEIWREAVSHDLAVALERHEEAMQHRARLHALLRRGDKVLSKIGLPPVGV
jgi:hypothetical protein